MKNNKNKLIILIISISVLLIAVSIGSYAYFTAIASGTELASTVMLNGGTLAIDYTEGEHLNIVNAYPKEEAWISKNFTLKGSNNTSLPMNYQIGLEVNKNTFNAGYLSYSLTNTVNEGGTPVSNVSNYALPIGQSTVTFGVGQFKTGQGVKHTYKLEIFFKDNENNQNVGGQEAEFDAKIIMKEAGTWPDRRLVEW